MSNAEERRSVTEIRTATDDLIEPRNVSDAGVWWGYGQEEEIVWEESCERLYGLEPGSFEGTHDAWLERVHPDDRERVEEEWWDAMEENRPYQMVYRIIRPDGEVRWIDARAVIFTNEDGEYERAVGVDTDITARLERFQQVQVLDRVLRHNLRNDLNVVQGYAELITEAASGESAEYARNILEECEQLFEKSRKQQSISRLLSAQSEPKPVDIPAVVSESVDEIEESYPDAVIQRDITEEATAAAIGLFVEAVTELLRNAIEHNDQDIPEISVTVSFSDSHIEIAVADNGPGIPEIEQQIVTGERAITQLHHASGLGLWLVSWVVRRTNGAIEFEENHPRGTTVRILVPKIADFDES